MEKNRKRLSYNISQAYEKTKRKSCEEKKKKKARNMNGMRITIVLKGIKKNKRLTTTTVRAYRFIIVFSRRLHYLKNKIK